MYCYRATMQTKKGDALIGWQIECVQNANLTTPVTIYADESSTPILSVSGVSNRAVSDDNGNFYFFVEDGVYGLRYYDSTGAYQRTDRYVTMYGALSGDTGSSKVGFKQSGTGAVARTAQDKMRETVSVKDFGAVGDGTADDRAALAAADTAGDFTLGFGVHRIASNLTLSSRIAFAGGVIKPAAGVTVTINGEIAAGAAQIFDTSLGGTVVIDGRKTPSGWAEWWGLTPESPGAASANVTAFNAAFVALRETRALARTYYTDAQLTLALAGHTFRGGGAQYDGATEGRVTRILCSSATAHILYAGASAFTTIAALPLGIEVSDVYLDRSVAPNVPGLGVGLFNRYTQFAKFRNVKSANSIITFQASGTVHSKFFDCHALRSAAGTGGTDLWRGFYIEGNTSIGLNGANASLYLFRFNAERGTAISDSIGILADHKMTDLFLLHPETSACTTGIEISGDAANTTLNYDNIDIQIVNPILDTFTFAGIYIHGLNKYGSVEVKGGYYGAASGATAAINITNNLSAVRIDGGQFLMGVATTTFGVRVATASNVLVDGCLINECTASAVVLDAATNCSVTPLVKNNSNTCGAAVQMFNTCTANVIAPIVSGGASKVQYGIQVVGTGDARNEYQVTGIDSACLPAANRKLDRNGTAVTAIGATGTNYAGGVFT